MNDFQGQTPESESEPAAGDGRPNVSNDPQPIKPPFIRPKLTFVPPKLVKHGNVSELTGFFGTFSP